MKTTIIYTPSIDGIRVQGTPNVDPGTGVLSVHTSGYEKVAHFERGHWCGFLVEDSAEKTPQQAAEETYLPAPYLPPTKDDDIPF
ncbi:hypothetical protein PssvBMR16_gp28 [Pseudomonas phage MR16]|uniref:Uncharacterized protein n=1 Tax=Pseudomonas phage MR5 TaxID=2711172 RepID=A0A6M3TCT3_9CAUD|nr:hypothetical protein PssvBMR5_gp25 [Pseudomonas phage MR5]QJD54912.1 hypothetical protein PssvBMR7_gp25 [Pseudomonas phage MR7]QJD54973.1 hypothetical protein PssvBMR8_gp25 [Pseudomonas phage MR8]QJD55030.1 hypothetical protein PssvBMR12_gp25 [Pseudomonas phage MR12]QJD55333.1 hypothetical protein PssvBMR18_gp25 [Pseudomonas phage MR18]QJF74597.1 hypothetical protein PssvBMR16_gp28 [Pseudomonas phage MR16]